VASTAVADHNPELVEARRRRIPVQRRREFLGSFAARTPFLSVAGTHGKTTTSSMLAVALRGCGVDPSWLIGAPVPALGGAASLGAGAWMVLEADESDGSFLAGPRAGALLTNAEPDHLEFWGGWEELQAAFLRFMVETDGPVVACADDAGSLALAERAGAVLYGASDGPGAGRAGLRYQMASLEAGSRGSVFELRAPGGTHRVSLALPGAHNALDAVGALALAGELGLDLAAACDAMADHTGLHRRFEHRGNAGGVEVVDDYAHLPTEVRAALRAGADGGWNRLVVVFQPHRFSRTEALWREFGDAFDRADVLVLTDIYPAGEEPREGITGRLLIDAVNRAGGPEPVWAPTLDEAAGPLAGLLSPGDLLMTVGAGDVRDVGDMVLAALGGAPGSAGPSGGGGR
jgi:UDP-N-acetylmuramate--alanine ligase